MIRCSCRIPTLYRLTLPSDKRNRLKLLAAQKIDLLQLIYLTSIEIKRHRNAILMQRAFCQFVCLYCTTFEKVAPTRHYPNWRYNSSFLRWIINIKMFSLASSTDRLSVPLCVLLVVPIHPTYSMLLILASLICRKSELHCRGIVPPPLN